MLNGGDRHLRGAEHLLGLGPRGRRVDGPRRPRPARPERLRRRPAATDRLSGRAERAHRGGRDRSAPGRGAGPRRPSGLVDLRQPAQLRGLRLPPGRARAARDRLGVGRHERRHRARHVDRHAGRHGARRLRIAAGDGRRRGVGAARSARPRNGGADGSRQRKRRGVRGGEHQRRSCAGGADRRGGDLPARRHRHPRPRGHARRTRGSSASSRVGWTARCPARAVPAAWWRHGLRDVRLRRLRQGDGLHRARRSQPVQLGVGRRRRPAARSGRPGSTPHRGGPPGARRRVHRRPVPVATVRRHRAPRRCSTALAPTAAGRRSRCNGRSARCGRCSTTWTRSIRPSA